jgi:hypothetical protein
MKRKFDLYVHQSAAYLPYPSQVLIPSHPRILNLLLEADVGEAEGRRSTIFRTTY